MPTKRSPLPTGSGPPPGAPAPFAAPPPPALDYPAPGHGPASTPPPRPAPPPPASGVLRATILRQMVRADPGVPSGLTATLAGMFGLVPQPLPRPPAPAASTRLSGSLRLRGWHRWWGAYLLVFGMGVLLLVRLAGAVGDWAGERLTTLQYGEIRTTHLSAYFGLPGETALAPTLITATNDHGTAHLWILPGEQVGRALVLEVPLPDDPDGRLPLHLVVADVDRDGHPDLLVQAGDGGLFPYLLDTGKGSFRLPTADELRRLVLPGGGR